MAKKMEKLPDEIFVWKETDRDGSSYYMVAEELSDIGDDAEFVGKYHLQQTGKISRSIEIDYGGLAKLRVDKK